MKEHPILFSAPMVRAINNGIKTQTRRTINPQPYIDGLGNFLWNGMNFGQNSNGPCINAIASPLPSSKTRRVHCPYGKPGDHLYVKEAAWMWCERIPNGITETGRQKWFYATDQQYPVFYCADHPDKPTDRLTITGSGNEFLWRKKIGRYLPRWASRTSIEITGIRVEMLQDISESDCRAEGIVITDALTLWHEYQLLWKSINEEGSWDFNPFVWVIEFKKVSK